MIRLDLPADFAVVVARDETLLDVRSVAPELAGWAAELRATGDRAGAELVAVRVADRCPMALVVAISPLPAGPDDVVLQGLRVLAAERIGVDGEVAVLDLQAGSAVASADVVVTDRGPAAVVVVQAPVPASGRLLTLTLSSPEPTRLPDCAMLAAAVATRISTDEEAA